MLLFVTLVYLGITKKAKNVSIDKDFKVAISKEELAGLSRRDDSGSYSSRFIINAKPTLQRDVKMASLRLGCSTTALCNYVLRRFLDEVEPRYKEL